MGASIQIPQGMEASRYGGINIDTRYGGINTDTTRYGGIKVWRHQYRHHKVWRHQYTTGYGGISKDTCYDSKFSSSSWGELIK